MLATWVKTLYTWLAGMSTENLNALVLKNSEP